MNVLSEFRLIDHDASLARLRELMCRVNSSLEPAEFISVVSNAYHAVTSADYEQLVHAIFRTSGSYENFRRVMELARDNLPARIRVLNIGCGAGYDLEVLAEVFAPSRLEHVLCSDLSPDMLARAKQRTRPFPCEFVVGTAADMLAHGRFDMVLTHSLVHHIPSLSAFLSEIAELIAPGGVYVMGHEPNARYWRNADCLAVLDQWEHMQRQRSTLRKWLDPRRYFNKLKRLCGLGDEPGQLARVNAYLREKHGFTTDLTSREIERLVDVHVPTRSPGDFRIGHEGFDPDRVAEEGLAGCELLGYFTSGYLGHANPARQSSAWQAKNAALAERYPHDGSIFSAVFRKTAS